MTDRSISNFLGSKLGRFISIFPDKIAVDIAKSAYLTGGALVSLKTKDKGIHPDDAINDYDIYFDDKSVLLSVVRYMVDKFHKNWRRNKRYKDVHSGFALKFRNIYDVEFSETDYLADDNNDIFLKMDIPQKMLELMSHKYTRKEAIDENDIFNYVTRHSFNLGEYQIITRFTGTPDVVHSFFDFEHAKGVYYFNTGAVNFPLKTIESILDKRLIYNGSKYPLASIFRSIKFIKRGWNIDKVQLLKMIFQLTALDLTNKHLLMDQLTGVYGNDIMEFFGKVEELDIEASLQEELLSTLTNNIIDHRLPVLSDGYAKEDEYTKEDNIPF